MIRRAAFLYSDQLFETSISVRPWTPADETVGGMRISAAGIPASYVVRRDALIELTLRLFEEEWPGFLNFLAFAQTAEQFVWYPDADEAFAYAVYLHAPSAGERVTPTRDGSMNRVFEVSITLRGVETTVPFEPYHVLGG